MAVDDLTAYKRLADRLAPEYQHAARTAREEKTALANARTHAEGCLEAQSALQTVAAGVQQQAHDQIARVVSRCLEAIFDDPYELHIQFERKRGKTEATLSFQRDGQGLDPTTAAGGGVVDVAAFALRLAALVLERPCRRKLLILDEPFRFISRDYAGRVRDLLAALSKEMKVQFVIVTHDPVLAGRDSKDTLGKVIRLEG